MDICGHCHNVLPRTVDRCTVCGTVRVDPAAADVRRRDDGAQPSHAPGWAAPSVPDTGIHPDDFLRELAGESSTTSPPPDEFPSAQALDRALPPRAIPAMPPPGALAGYLGTTVDRSTASTNAPSDTRAEAATPDQAPPHDPPNVASLEGQTAAEETAQFAQHLSTATRVAPDGVAARTTRLDGTVKLGSTPSHRALTIGAPIVAGLFLVLGVMGSYNIRTSQAEEVEAAEAASATDMTAIEEAANTVVRLDLDGCGIIGRTTGFLFSNNTVLVPQSSILTDHRPTVVAADGTTWSAEVQGWDSNTNLAVVRPTDRMSGGLEWGVSSRIRQGDTVSVLTATEPGVASSVLATIATTNTLNGRNTSFELDINAVEGSILLNTDGFVIGVFDDQNLAQVSDDLAPAISRVVLEDERPQAVCPVPTTVAPPTTLTPDADGTTETEDTGLDE